ncbi:assimilatory sulfite reductase [Fomitiporia mediterranea MF3/22]|uniref:assimilatory sulfite reductase n=1 Tax=Fomitiporia mediterranea (strain MF3/22) TaxID=694068 RepID=UPI000440741F|nr:assimilatory sulfite reductase [Fomitiporia mediterranea MF3/22]EJD00965.1 assimilatory sulfite reductase [Fomitiporia mediterranea MF3/22]
MARNDSRETASALIEQVASESSSSIFVYDLAEHAGFGLLTKQVKDNDRIPSNVVGLQTRSGAGLNLVGRLSEEGTSKDVHQVSVLTAYTTPSGVAAMAPSFAFFPQPTASSRVVLQVPTVTPVGQTLELSPTLAPLNSILGSLPESFAILLSSSPQESIDLASAAYTIGNTHVVHLFDHYSAGRELGHPLVKPVVPKNSGNLGVQDALKAAGYAFFDYVGDANATEVLVLLNGPLASAAQFFAKNKSGFGVIIVRVLRPWDEALFLSALPKTVESVRVVDEVLTEGMQGVLYTDVFATCLGSKTGRPTVRSVRVVPSLTQKFLKSPSSFASFLGSLVHASLSLPAQDVNLRKLLFFEAPSSPLASLPHHVVNTFKANRTVQTRAITDCDVFTKPGGIAATRIILSSNDGARDFVPLHVHLPLGEGRAHEEEANFIAVLDQSLVKSHSILSYTKPNSVVLLFSSWTNLEVLNNLPSEVLSNLRDKSVKIYTINVKALEAHANAGNIIGHLAFLRLYLGPVATEALLRKLAHSIYGTSSASLNLDKLNAKAWAALEEVDITEPGELSAADEGKVELKSFEFNAISADGFELDQSSLPGAHISSWHEAARHILFPDAFVPANERTTEEEYPQNPALRPELPERTFLVTCSVNRRLTPLDYDRNVFHLEFDTSGTGLKYAIGEALGVHGWNDTDEVLDFCKWYGVDPDRLITIPVPGAEGKVHTRTIFQALQQQIDLFGKPPKSFYADLANHATSKNDKLTLQFVGSPEGSSMFKKLSEKDTVTFADVLLMYKSARPSIEVLCEMIGDIKPRHYSIASAQSVVGDRVDLLVVTVEWETPSGSPRFGQCTRYLAGLKVGQKVTVSIKPSVMKLPPDDMQPLILAGLGTGAAPFRAFLQHRALLSSQNKPSGPLFYYFGSRYRSKEYLYGEEIEAFILDKTISHAGLAFSRDGPRKVYIQHKMLDDAETLVKMLHREKGVFYLCGPTWPVPDVFETLVNALVKYNGLTEAEAAAYLEGLKEEERYVLEVY